MPTTIEKEIRRVKRNRSQPRLGLALMDHIILIESWISIKTPVAPIKKVAKPTTVTQGVSPMNIPPPQKLITAILRATAKIQMEFPEHYRYLSETPLFIFDKQKGISIVDFEEYLASLVEQLTAFEQAGKKPANM